MSKVKWFILGIVVFFTLGQVCPPGSPEYIYRDLDMTGHCIYNIADFVEMKLIDWSEGTDVMASGYYETNGVNDELYGVFSMPIRIGGGRVVIDSLFICAYFQGAGDLFLAADIYSTDCNMANHLVYTNADVGDGDVGWDRYQLATDDDTTTNECYNIYLECANDGAADIRVGYCIEVNYHTID